MITDQQFEDLEQKGYTVVPDVISAEDCDAAICQYQIWLSQFKNGTWPKTFSGIINRYNTGHMIPTWEIRLKTKPVFAQLWKTEKLLTSFDAISIGRPPEDGEEEFQKEDDHWLHTDQHASRLGLHAYQGGVYLEEQCKDDWTFHVMEDSHKYLEAFYDLFSDAAQKSEPLGVYYLARDEVDFIKDLGCSISRVAVPKGGMILWDSRLIHANARPLKNRKHPNRWRYTIFVSMTPAIWASDEDIADHKEAYENVWMTSHWSSQDITGYPSFIPHDITCPTEIPEAAMTEEAKKLAGVIIYDFKDGQSNGDSYRPNWKQNSKYQN